MDSVSVLYEDNHGKNGSTTIQRASIKCPFCKMHMIPKFMYLCVMGQDNYNVFCQCTNPECTHSFISEYRFSPISSNTIFIRTAPNASMDVESFSDIIQEISSAFCDIYNQAYAAQQMNLSQICGGGYRKALEFLIKDYIIGHLGKNKESIEQKNLSKCIKEDISDERIKAVAERAVWLGNDETHYVRKWEDKDIKDLIGLIHLTIRWIESEVETKRLLEDMPSQ